MNKIFLLFSYHVFTPLLVGVFIYLCKDNYLTPVFNVNRIPNFFIYQLPDALWAYAFCASLFLIWRGRGAAVITLGAFSLCSFYEFMQYANWTAGTFDWWDIGAMGLACLLCYFSLRHADFFC